MTRVAWFNCQAGVAGDMTMAALVDAGADPDDVAAAIAALGVDGYALTFEPVQRCGVRATWANVVTMGEHDHADEFGQHDAGHGQHGHGGHRRAADVLAMLDAADLPDRVRARARAVFERLAVIEAEIHGVDPDEVELHEVGSLDSIIDVVGACAALESLGVDRLQCGPLGVGTGTVSTAHGPLPNPAPATVALLARSGIGTSGLPTTLETVTPTGAALMAVLGERPGPMPPMAIASVGYGAGTADPPERANVVQVVVGESVAGPTSTGGGDVASDPGAPVVVVEVNVDDVTPEVVAHTIARLLDEGAHDAWATPIVMKKGRPAFSVAALCDPSALAPIRRTLLDETGSLGVRATELRRWPQRRAETTVEVDGWTIGVKVAGHRVKVEFDDAARAAAATGRPVREVLDAARAAFAATSDGRSDDPMSPECT
jgi:uncharacterized protein (TIGR00299 family) protein